jgi:hypothetical protein
MTTPEELAGLWYRMGLGAAQRRNLSAALSCAALARVLDPDHGGAARLGELCRLELGEAGEAEDIRLLAGQKKWKAAARAAARVPRQTVRLLSIQGCLWALAKRPARAAECFAGVLARDCGNRLAAEALAFLGRRRRFKRRFFGGFLCFSLMK